MRKIPYSVRASTFELMLSYAMFELILRFHERIAEQECIPVGCVPSATVAVCPGGGVFPGAGDVCPGGVCLPGECTPPPRGQTDICVNINLSTTTVAGGKIASKYNDSVEDVLPDSNFDLEELVIYVLSFATE